MGFQASGILGAPGIWFPAVITDQIHGCERKFDFMNPVFYEFFIFGPLIFQMVYGVDDGFIGLFQQSSIEPVFQAPGFRHDL